MEILVAACCETVAERISVSFSAKGLSLDINSDKTIRCSRVEISEDGISEVNGRGGGATIPRARIREIKLCYESKAKHPFSRYFLGYILLIFGIIGLLVDFLASVGEVSLIAVGSGDFVIPLIPVAHWCMIGIGFWLLVGIFRARYLLSIRTDEGVRRIFFEKKVTAEEIQQFLRRAQFSFGYTIDVSILREKSLLV